MKFLIPMFFGALIVAVINSYSSKLSATRFSSEDLENIETSVPLLEMQWPSFGPISSPFGTRKGGFHYGIDIASDPGTPVYAIAQGKVYWAAKAKGYGNTIILDHPFNLQSTYAHLDKIYVRWGQKVSTGELIGTVGSTGVVTGPHLHFEVRLASKALNPTEVFTPHPGSFLIDNRFERIPEGKKAPEQTKSLPFQPIH
ncbi:M23 family metallopeptidase [Pseudobacteriovorax antillogorgiicola]|uniref:Peptidase family M23 n=1 Tax=Pseudobacteriovorax antillogorgiicola TaxID=1513793 RepID=A0A1Y6BFN4_9BACT|nr:M23 family metallopeptidase [Pseudobacteriovorax antillogorgiicola]TCS57359.1 peptidase M23-like protein [Pseudobacteriovorax antillogorgiicola]SMF02021.1 Peptidase family M23 [Pseudobacteriovorax antillogorgiicola]